MIDEHPLFTVVSVVYNDAEGIRRTEGSVRSQAERNFEWIVVDGGSTDGTVAYLKTLSHPYLSWSSEYDRGIYDAMNKGTSRARGRYVVYMNGGDAFSDAQCLADVRDCLMNAGWPELLYGGANWRFANGDLKHRPPRRLASAIRHGLPGMHQSTFYKREFLDVPPYDLSYPVSADYYVSARCYAKGAKACYIDRALADFTVGGNSMAKADQSLKECWRLQREILQLGLPARVLSAVRRIVTHRALALMHRLKRP